MQFTSAVSWTGSDFMVAALIIGGIGLMAEILVRVSPDRFYRAGSAAALAAIFLTVWSNLAVGIVGDGANEFNLAYMGLVLLAVIGAALARFRAAGMMLVAILAIVCLAAVAFAAAWDGWRVWPQTLFLMVPWALAAALFRKAAWRTAA
jgi:hypothetical protein